MSADRLFARQAVAALLSDLGGRHRVLARIDMQAGAVHRATVHVVAARHLDGLAQEVLRG